MPLHRGKIATPPDIISIRPLTREDLALIPEARPVGQDGRPINGAVKRFRDPHHRVARLFAMGLRPGEIMERCGYSYQRVYQLSTDPAFQNLVAKYRAKVDEKFAENADEFFDLASANMRKAETMIAERLEEAEETGEAIPLKTLETLASSRMDRFGYGKRETRLNVNMDFASQLEGAIARSGKAKLIEATSHAQPQSAPKVVSPHPVPSVQTSLPVIDRRVLRRA